MKTWACLTVWILTLATGCSSSGSREPDARDAGDEDAGELPDDGGNGDGDLAGADEGGDPGGDEGPSCAEMQIGGLAEVVEMYVDEHGIVHLSCSSDEDCMVALGYVHASRRFFTMDVGRRAARGTLATLYGTYGIDNDVAMRGYLATPQGVPLEEAIWEKLGPGTRALYEAYASGVNAWLGDMRAGRNGARPSEEYSYRDVSGILPQDVLETLPDWHVLDSVALWVSVMHGNSDFLVESTMYTTALYFPVDVWFDLFVPRPAVPGSIMEVAKLKRGEVASGRVSAPVASRIDPALIEGVRAHDQRLRETLDLVGIPRGSNNWALSSGFTGGPAIHAGDPHGPLRNPPYCNGLVIDAVTHGDGTLHVGGISFGGQPIFPLGFNRDVAWGCTVSYADVTDLYVDTVSPDATGVELNGETVPFVERTDTFEVAGGDPITVTFRWVPHHGPVVSGTPADAQVLTRKWTGHSAPLDIEAYLDLMRAGSVAEAMSSLERAEGTGCNAVLADSAGQAGWHVAVRIPARPWASASLAPWSFLPGDGQAEWQAYLPMHEHPRMQDPSLGFVTTSNNAFTDAWDDGDPTNDGRPYWQSTTSPGYRHLRITGLLEPTRDAHKPADSLALQSDTFSVGASGIVPGLLGAAAADPDALSPSAADLVAALSAWEFTCPTGLDGDLPDSPASLDEDLSRESIGCTAYHAALVYATRGAFLDEYTTYGQPTWFTVLGAAHVLYRALAAPGTMRTGDGMWDDLFTDGVVETRDQVLRDALNQAADLLSTSLGVDPDGWRWGRLHTLTLPASIQLPEWGIGPYANDGALISVDLGLFYYEQTGFAHVHGPATRLVVELDPAGPHAHYQVPGGLDLHRDSPYYDNLVTRWLANEPVPMAFSRTEAESSAQECTHLVP